MFHALFGKAKQEAPNLLHLEDTPQTPHDRWVAAALQTYEPEVSDRPSAARGTKQSRLAGAGAGAVVLVLLLLGGYIEYARRAGAIDVTTVPADARERRPSIRCPPGTSPALVQATTRHAREADATYQMVSAGEKDHLEDDDAAIEHHFERSALTVAFGPLATAHDLCLNDGARRPVPFPTRALPSRRAFARARAREASLARSARAFSLQGATFSSSIRARAK